MGTRKGLIQQVGREWWSLGEYLGEREVGCLR